MMKRRIITCVLLFSLIFSMLAVPSLASTVSDDPGLVSDTDYLLEEMTANIPGFAPSDYSKGSGVPRVIGWTLSEDQGEGRSLQAYIYNPNTLYLDGGELTYITLIGEGPDKMKEKKTIHIVDYSSGSYERLFVKVELKDFYESSSSHDLLTEEMSEIEYTIEDLRLDMKVAPDSKVFSYDLIIDGVPLLVNISRQEDAFSISYSRENIVTLDVKHTVYRTESTSELGTVDEISSVYFAIPEEYFNYYDKLYSVTASYIKKRTKPYLVTPAPVEYGKDLSYINPNWDYWYDFQYSLGDDEGYDFLYGYTTGEDRIKAEDFKYYISDYNTFFGSFNSFTKIEDAFLPSSKVFEFFQSSEDYYYNKYIGDLSLSIQYPLSSDYINEKLYSSIEDYSEGITTTIDDTWTSLSYYTSSDASDYFRDYGLWAWILATFSKDDDSLYERLLANGYIDADYTDYIDAQKLLLCNDQIRNDLASMKKEDFCNNYCINPNDFSTFKQYLADNKYVILYRFDIDSYHFAQIIPMMFDLSDKTHVVEEPYWYAVVEQSLYYDFEVIDVTFKEENQYVSLCTTSEKQNISGGITWVDPDAGYEELPDVDEILDILPDYIKDNADDLFGKFMSVLRTIGVVVAVVLVIVAVVFVIDKGSEIFVAISNRKNKK